MVKASLVVQLVKNPPARQETPVGFLGWEDLLEKGTATHSSIEPHTSVWLKGLSYSERSEGRESVNSTSL